MCPAGDTQSAATQEGRGPSMALASVTQSSPPSWNPRGALPSHTGTRATCHRPVESERTAQPGNVCGNPASWGPPLVETHSHRKPTGPAVVGRRPVMSRKSQGRQAGHGGSEGLAGKSLGTSLWHQEEAWVPGAGCPEATSDVVHVEAILYPLPRGFIAPESGQITCQNMEILKMLRGSLDRKTL